MIIRIYLNKFRPHLQHKEVRVRTGIKLIKFFTGIKIQICYYTYMKKLLILCLVLCAVCLQAAGGKLQTVREAPQYLSTDGAAVEDTCPGNDIFKQFFCSAKEESGFKCFDVYRVEGDPIDAERYTLLAQTLTTENSSAEPACTFEGELTCDNFLKALNYNLSFSWFIDNFPSSSFPECGKTYSCTRVSCLRALPPSANAPVQAAKLTCVFKKNQIYFLGTEVSCQNKR